MRISVIIPCYNSGAFLEATFASVVAQTVRPFEVLLLDDGSTNDTWQRLEGFRSRHGDLVRIFRRPENLGYGTRSELIGHAGSDWIATLDHDDLWEPTKLEKQMRAHRRHPEAAVIHTDGWVETAGDPSSRRRLETPDYRGPADPFEALYFRNYILASSPIFHRNWLDRVGGLGYYKYRLVGDHEMWMRLAREGARFVRVPEPLTTWLIHRTGQVSTQLVAHFRSIESMYAEYEEHNLGSLRIPPHRARHRVFRARLDVIRNLLHRDDPAGYEEAADRWTRLLGDWPALNPHHAALTRLIALARGLEQGKFGEGRSGFSAWPRFRLAPAEREALHSEWLRAREDREVREKIARDTAPLFRRGGINPPFAQILNAETRRVAELTREAWDRLERHDWRERRNRWLPWK